MILLFPIAVIFSIQSSDSFTSLETVNISVVIFVLECLPWSTVLDYLGQQ